VLVGTGTAVDVALPLTLVSVIGVVPVPLDVGVELSRPVEVPEAVELPVAAF
jgi:hypothetical protein